MEVEVVGIETLSGDPANARQHPERNLAAIKASLRRFGQQKPIVVDSNGVVRAGNGTLAAARALGWSKISVVRSDLTLSEISAYAIADNRTGELAEWDEDVLAKLLADTAIGDVGFDAREIASLLSETGRDSEVEAGELSENWMVVVTCKDESDQAGFLGRMCAEGRECKALLG